MGKNRRRNSQAGSHSKPRPLKSETINKVRVEPTPRREAIRPWNYVGRAVKGLCLYGLMFTEKTRYHSQKIHTPSYIRIASTTIMALDPLTNKEVIIAYLDEDNIRWVLNTDDDNKKYYELVISYDD